MCAPPAPFCYDVGMAYECAQDYIDALVTLRDEYLEEIPASIVRTHPATHKVQKNWFNSLFLLLGEAVHDQLLSPADVLPVGSFLAYVSSREFKEKDRITAEDIQRGNEAIRVALLNLMRAP
jgi:hypothetical protein